MWKINWGIFKFLKVFECACMLSYFSHVWLRVTPLDCSPPGSSIHGILQARILERVAMSSSRGSSWLSDQTHSSYMSGVAGGFFTTQPLGKPKVEYAWGKYLFIPTPGQKRSEKKKSWGFPLGSSVVKNPPANAGDTGLTPDPGRSHMPRHN